MISGFRAITKTFQTKYLKSVTTPIARPFLKWAGGKTQLLGELTRRVPEVLKEGSLPVFVEPFVGGGAVYFHFNTLFDFRECHLFDVNEELVLAYSVVKNDVSGLIDYLGKVSDEFLAKDAAGRKEYYYAMRSLFNSQKEGIDYDRYSRDWIERAGQLIFLNRTCFNGLFRVNSSGGFNVPFGSYRNPTILFEDLLKVDSAVLQNTTIHHGDFMLSGPLVSEESFVYFDPPYRPLNRTSSFTQYAKGRFDDDDQRRLAEFYARCDAAGAKLMLSNSDPRNIEPDDDFFDTLYAAYRVDRVPAKRMINSDGAGRGDINEIIVTNY